ncbi:MAG: hypothetical protein K9L79_16320 [Methylobacter tundripaludum]|nr:hypothetical protein [Methylobacter tundripaludum]
MKVQVLRSAMEGLAAGRKFYDRQDAGVGDYFFDSLFAENRFTGDFEKYAMQACLFLFF